MAADRSGCHPTAAGQFHNKLRDIDLTKLRDIDLTKHKTRPPPCKEFTPPAIAPGFIVGESCGIQIDRLMNQITAQKLSFKGFDMLFQEAVRLHHSRGFRGMRIVGHGSSVLCIWAAYMGDPVSGTVDHAQEISLKVPHFTSRRPHQENRMANDSIVKLCILQTLLTLVQAHVCSVSCPNRSVYILEDVQLAFCSAPTGSEL